MSHSVSPRLTDVDVGHARARALVGQDRLAALGAEDELVPPPG